MPRSFQRLYQRTNFKTAGGSCCRRFIPGKERKDKKIYSSKPKECPPLCRAQALQVLELPLWAKRILKLPKNKSITGQIPRKKLGACVWSSRKESPLEEELKDPEKPNIQIPVMTGILSSPSKGRAEDYIPQPSSRTYRSERPKR